MKFPNFLSKSTFTARAFVLLVGLLLMVSAASAQKTDAPTANPSGDLDQCRNGSDGSIPCTGNAWVNGNAGAQNSGYAEDQYIPYRMRFSNLKVGSTYTVVLGYDIKHSGAHAIDYLGTWNNLTISNRATNTATTRTGIDPCSNVPGCTGSPTSTIPIGVDSVAVTSQINPYTNSPVYQPNNQVMAMWGGSLQTFAYTGIDGNVATDSQVERQITITFIANQSNPVLAWSGHVGYGGDWGAGNSAGGISGSPYHMRFKGLGEDGGAIQGGNQDRSLSADAVIISGIVNIIKVANTFDGSGVAFTAFPFTASSNFGTTSFSLTDNVPGSAGVTQQSAAITNFGAGNEVVVSEQNTSGWTLADLSCTTNVAASAQTQIFTQPAAFAGTTTITVSPGGQATCTFTNSQVNVTAAPASVSGRVTSIDGTGLRGVSVTLYDISSGTTLRTTTNSFGVYRFSGLDTQDFYRVVVSSRQYTFRTASKSFTLLGDLANLNFVTAE